MRVACSPRINNEVTSNDRPISATNDGATWSTIAIAEITGWLVLLVVHTRSNSFNGLLVSGNCLFTADAILMSRVSTDPSR